MHSSLLMIRHWVAFNNLMIAYKSIASAPLLKSILLYLKALRTPANTHRLVYIIGLCQTFTIFACAFRTNAIFPHLSAKNGVPEAGAAGVCLLSEVSSCVRLQLINIFNEDTREASSSCTQHLCLGLSA